MVITADDLNQAQLDVLQAIYDLQGDGDDVHPGTDAVGRKLLEILKSRGGPVFWMDASIWHGTDPMARQLADYGLITVGVGAAKFRAPSAPIPRADKYFLSLTQEGRRLLRSTSNHG